MSSENEPGFKTEQIYKKPSRYPTKSILIPALKVGALAGKRLSFNRCLYTNAYQEGKVMVAVEICSKNLLDVIKFLMLLNCLVRACLLLYVNLCFCPTSKSKY